jgi:Pyruvate/2-oxoacid:ferredoxin oxidoreductase gamma subunit
LLEEQALRAAVEDSVPPAFRELNLKAFQKGFEYGTTSLPLTAESEVVAELHAD